jgi:hypothetical protein
LEASTSKAYKFISALKILPFPGRGRGDKKEGRLCSLDTPVFAVQLGGSRRRGAAPTHSFMQYYSTGNFYRRAGTAQDAGDKLWGNFPCSIH